MNSATVAATNTHGRMEHLPLAQIVAGNNPRKYFDPAEMDELVASIKANGIIQPIVVRPVGNGQFAIVAGERRFRAAGTAQLADIPAVIKELSDEDADRLALVENTDRSDMSVSEEAEAAGKVLERANGDRDEAARLLGWPLSKLSRRIALLNLIPEAMEALTERKILVGHAELLATVPQDKQAKALDNIINMKLSVQQVRDFLVKVSTDFKTAIFDTSDCSACKYNSNIQSSLFTESIGANDRCTNGDCYKAKTAQKVTEIVASLAEEVQTVKVLEIGDSGFAKLICDGGTGVGAEQYEACKLCAKLGATVSNIPGEVGKVERDICFDGDCNMKKVADRIKADKEAANAQKTDGAGSGQGKGTTPSTKGQATKPKAPAKVSDVSQKIKDYRRKEVWEIAAKKELVAQIPKAKSFALDLLLTGDGRLINRDNLVTYFGKIAGEPYPEESRYNDKKVGFPEKVHPLTMEQQDKMLAAAAVSAVSSPEIKDDRLKKLLGFLNADLSKHFTLSEAFLTLLTKTEIEAVCVSVGLDTAVKDFKKVMSGKKDEAIKTILAAEFNFVGAVPPILNYL